MTEEQDDIYFDESMAGLFIKQKAFEESRTERMSHPKYNWYQHWKGSVHSDRLESWLMDQVMGNHRMVYPSSSVQIGDEIKTMTSCTCGHRWVGNLQGMKHKKFLLLSGHTSFSRVLQGISQANFDYLYQRGLSHHRHIPYTRNSRTVISRLKRQLKKWKHK